MNWTYRKPLFLSITTLKNAKSGTDALPSAQFVLTWTYPTNFLNPITTHDASDVLSYDLYRHIETVYPTSSADGGPGRDPSYLGVQISNTNAPRYFKIATLTNAVTSYTDTLSDLAIHSSEGLVLSNGRWVDGAGNDIIRDIVETKRRIYYRIEATSKRMIFNNLPFLFVVHANGAAECRSTIRQVRWNRLYDEGETVWYSKIAVGETLLRTAVDQVWDIENKRTLNVWFTSSAGKVYCVDGRDGTVKQTYTSFAGVLLRIQSIRIDPATGDAIVLGDANSMWRCVLSDGTSTNIGNMGTTEYSPYGNIGLVIDTENSAYKVYSVANNKKIVTWPLNSPAGTAQLKYLVGDTDGSTQVPASHRNVFGITNGVDQGVWVNGHVPVHFQYSQTESYQVPGECRWLVPECYKDYCGGGWRRDINEPDHYACDPPTTVYYNVNYDFWMLQDIGYVYGVSQINYGQTHSGRNLSLSYPYGFVPAIANMPFTRGVVGRTWAGAVPAYSEPEKGYSYGSINAAKTQPEPTAGQYGLACDVPSDGLLRNTSYKYNIWQTNAIESRVNVLTAVNSGTTTQVSYLLPADQLTNRDYVSGISTPFHTCVDSSNCVWVIQGTGFTKIYPLANGSTFPYQGNCAWPTDTPPTRVNGQFDALNATYDFDTPFNNAFVDYVLTRTAVPVATASAAVATLLTWTGGTKINGTDIVDEMRIAREWCLANPSTSLAGTRVYPNFVYNSLAPYSSATFSIHVSGGLQTEYNSDNTGMCAVFTVQKIKSDPDFIRPAEEFPTTDLKIYFKRSTPRLGDSTFWDALSTENVNNTSVSGFDDMTVFLSAGTYNGTFGSPTWEFGYDDKYKDIGGLVNDYSSGRLNTNQTSYRYNDPSQSGKPTVRWAGLPGEVDGTYTPTVSAWFHPDPYLVYGTDPSTLGTGSFGIGYTSLTSELVAKSPYVSAFVWERWPTAEFFVTTFETSACRPSGWNWTPPLPYVGDNNLPERDPNRVVFGYDPVSAQFTDYSVARTWPVCAWYWDFGDSTTFYGFPLPTLLSECGGPHRTSAVLVCSDPAFHPWDSAFTTHPNMIDHFYRGAGIYKATLWVAVSNTDTSSWPISAGVTDQSLMYSTFTVAATRLVDVRAACPVTNFSLISGATVQSDYSDNNNNSMFDVNLSGVQAFQTSDGEFISGYAPNLTIFWTGCATPRSLPLCAAVWDFSDSYSEGSIYTDSFATDITGRYNYPQEITYYPYPISGWPYWEIPGGYNSAVSARHTFVMPGFYDVTLHAVVSSEVYTNTCAPCTKYLHVYVEEIEPQPCFLTSYSSISGYDNTVKGGTSPFTLYFNPSCTLPGSFPICKLEWDFGDGTSGRTVSRLFSSDYVFVPGVTAFPTDPADPRNVIIEHVFNRTLFSQPSSLIVYLSAYACNTNTVAVVSAEVGPFNLARLTEAEGDVHLVENRMFKGDDDLLLVFESEKNQQTYNVLISSVLMNEG